MQNLRIEKVRSYLARKGLDGFLLSNESNVTYLSGFFGSDSAIIITPGENIFITDFRYREESQALVGFEIVIRKDGLERAIVKICRKEKIKRLGFESESLSFKNCQDLHYALAQPLRARAGLTRTELVPCERVVDSLREIKDGTEVALIRKSAKIAADAMRFAKKMLKPGISEKALANKIEAFIKEKGARGVSFGLIVASGPNSSKPHARATDRKIGRNDAVVVDLGANFQGYNSDLTRALFLGKINKSISRVYRIVKKAQELAISRVRPGVRIKEIDLAARRYIAKFGYGKYFGHATGHGVGLEVHEAPRIWRKSRVLLKAGMVFTVEPAVYIPGKFGIRIEDMVLVSPNGCEVLTDDPFDYVLRQAQDSESRAKSRDAQGHPERASFDKLRTQSPERSRGTERVEG